MKSILALSFIFFSSAYAQQSAIPDVAPSVDEFIKSSGDQLEKMEPSCENFEACSYMNYHTVSYRFKGDAQEAFEKLVSMKPTEIWNKTSRFEMEYDPEQLKFVGKYERLPAINIGQTFFLELDITRKMKIPVAFQVVELNHAGKTLTFSYLKQNKSNGAQRITFRQEGSDIVIEHETHFKSESKFRDKYLYEFFHTRLLNDVWNEFGKGL